MLRRFAIDDYVLHDITDSTMQSWISPDGLEGLGRVDLRVNSYDNPGEDGGTVSNILLSKRLLTLPGVVTGDTETEFLTNRRTLEQNCSILRDGDGLPVARRLTFTTIDGNAYFVYGHVENLNVLTRENSWAAFQLQIVCPDAQLFIDTLVSSGALSRPSGSGVAWPWTWPVTWGTTTGGVVTVYNSGNASSWPTITFTGPATNPAVVHQESGTLFELNTTLVAGDSVVVDMKEHTVIKNGTTNLFSAKTDTSDWFSIAPGNNTLTYSTGVTTDTGTMEATFYSAVLGV